MRIASLLLSRLEGLVLRVITWEIPERPTIDYDWLWHAIQCAFFLLVKSQCPLQNRSMILFMYSDNQEENIKVDMSDHGTWSKCLTLHWSICIIPHISDMLPKLKVRTEHPNLHACDSSNLNRAFPACCFCILQTKHTSMYQDDSIGRNSNLENPIGWINSLANPVSLAADLNR